jgi:hypothetical protein
MEVGYSRLVTISTDNMLATNDYRSGAGAHWTFLSDPGPPFLIKRFFQIFIRS